MESPEFILKLVWIILGGAGVVVLGLLSWGVKSLISVSFENTIEIRILNKKIDDIVAAVVKINKLEQDLNHAHSKIRELNESYRNGNRE